MVATLPKMRSSLLTMAILALLGAACAGEDPAVAPVPSSSPTTTSPAGSAAGDAIDTLLLAGSFEIPGARAFGDPGFHEPFVLLGRVPEAAAGVAGEVVVRLRDVGRPNQTCSRDHPLSGCVTVDWSDFESRPGVPAGGVFDNHLNLVSTSGPVDVFLSEDRGLAATPDQYSPT